MCNPVYDQKNSEEKFNELSKKVKEDYYKKKGISEPKDKPSLFAF